MAEITWHNEKRAIRELIPYEANPRQITEKQAKDLKASLAKFGIADPIIINTDNMIIGGHQRKKILETLLGYDPDYQIDVRVPDRELGLDEARELNIRLNKNTGSWDFDVLANEFELDDLLDWGFDKGELDLDLWAEDAPEDVEPQIDKAEELREKWGVESGQLWQLGEHRLICGDCTDKAVVERVMGEDRADCVFTSPPYAVGVDYGETYQDTIDNLRVMLPKLSRIWLDILRPGGFAVVNFGDIVSASHIVGVDGPCEYPMALEYWPVFRADGWVLWSRRIWCKPGAGTGSMQCISSNRAATDWEHIWTWKKDGPAMFAKQTTGDFPSQNGWIDSTHSEGLEYGLKVHGAGMPPLPAMYSISNHSLTGGIVVEPFTGTGTTLIACERLGRKCRAVEISPAYVAVAIQRWVDVTGGTSVLLEG